MEIRDLTKAEEEIMQVLWDIEPAFVKDIIEKLPEPKPAYNTVSTIVRILETKGFVDHEAFGKTHRYFSIIKKEDYRNFVTGKLMGNYFENSVESLISYFVQEKKIDLKETDEIMKLLKNIK